MNLGEKLFELRKKKNLTQDEVAEKLNVTRQTVSKWETNQSTPDFDKIIPLCELYEISTDELLKCDLGNTEIKEVLNKCNVKADCGNIEIDTISIQEDSTIKVDLGNVNINKTNDIYIETDVDLGKTNISQNNRNSEITLKINCDCGNVTVGK